MKRLLLLLALWIGLSCVAAAQEQDAWGLSKPWRRLEWFYGLRAFPFNDVPAGAWLRAYEQAQQMPIYQGEGLQAQALNWEFYGAKQHKAELARPRERHRRASPQPQHHLHRRCQGRGVEE
jgi:hypothetical protein